MRTQHYSYIQQEKPDVDWFEILTENYLVPGGRPLYHLEKIRQDYPMVMHGVSLSIGSTDPLNLDYLQQVKQLAQRIKPAWISDHLCWTSVNNVNSHDLLPLPYTEEAIKHVVERVKRVQDFLGRQILLENVSSYVTYTDSQMPEWEFLKTIARQADCLILLDINNIYVSAFNHDFDPYTYINAIPIERVQQFHLAGHSQHDSYIIDTHDNDIIEAVYTLYKYALKRFGKVSTMIERDDSIPAFPELFAELNDVKRIAHDLTS